MGSVVELRPRAKEEFTSSLGMIIFLGSWGMMFAGLFFAYGFLRSGAPSWPPPGVPRLPVALPALNTAILLGSSFALAHGVRELRRGRRRALTVWVGATLALGAVFLGLQLAVWRSVAEGGLHVTTGLYGSVFYALTVFHALHVAARLLILLWVFLRSLRGGYSQHQTSNVQLCSMFWHFVDAVWVLMFVTIYVV